MKDVFKVIDIGSIVPSKTNPRKNFDKNKLKELEDSIREKGILQPILVRPHNANYEIVSGERRYRASVSAGLKEMPVTVRELDDKAVLEIQLIENSQRDDVHPLEEAEGYERLMKQFGYAGADQIAEKVGKSKSFVYQRLKLLDLVPECRKMSYDDLLSPSVSVLIARIPADLQKRAAKDVQGLSYRAAEALIQRDYMLSLRGNGFAKDDRICPERGSCATCTKRTGNQELLFPDVKSADVCTDPECFHAKRQTYIKSQEEKARKTGMTVLKTETVFQDGEHLGYGYVDLNEKCPYDAQQRTYKEVLENDKDFNPRVAVDGKGKIREVVRKGDVDKVLNNKEVAANKKAPSEDKEKLDKKVRETVSVKAIILVLERFKSDVKQLFWKVFAEAILGKSTTDTCFLFAKKIDTSIKRDDAQSFLEKHLNQIPSADYPAFVCELLTLPAWAGSSEYSDTMIGLCELYQINLDQMEKDARVEVKAEIKKAEKATKQVKVVKPDAKKVKSVAPVKDPDAIEVDGEKGERFVVKTKDKQTPEEKKAAEAGLKKLFGRK